MRTSFITTVAFAALAWAAPMSKRVSHSNMQNPTSNMTDHIQQCFVDENGVQGCIDNPICKINEDGVETCVSKRDAVQKRQCYVSEDGVQTCIDNPICHTNDDGSIYCVSKTKRTTEGNVQERDALPSNEKRQCYVDEQGVSQCNETPTCYENEEGNRVCVL